MKKSVYTLYYFLCLFILLTCSSSAQLSDTSFSFKNEIGFGAMRYSRDEYMLSVSANKIYKNNSELSILLYGFLFNTRKQISASLAYNWATTKKRSRFIFYISPELNFLYEWRNKAYSDQYIIRYGPFIVLGLIPSYRISERIKLNMEFKLGYGYLWGYNNKHYYQGKSYDNLTVGTFAIGLPAIRINYYFHKTKN